MHAYIIGENNQVNYPLMSPWGDVELPVADACMHACLNIEGKYVHVLCKNLITSFF